MGSHELPNWVEHAALTQSNRRALSFGQETWTFQEQRAAVAAATRQLAQAMTDTGKVGIIGILSANRPGFVFAVHAAANLGAPFVPLNWRQSRDELTWQLLDANITVLVVDEPHAAIAAAALGKSVAIINIEELESADSAEGYADPFPPISLNQEAAVLYTSGTSGRPKGARLTYGNLWFSAVASALHLGHHSGDEWLAVLPMFHIGGLSIVYRSVIGGTSLTLHDRFIPERALAAIDAGATLVSLVPTMLQSLMAARPAAPWPAHLRAVLLGGGPASPELLERAIALGIPVAPTYGLTESASQVTTLDPALALHKPGSSGTTLPTTQLRINKAKEGLIGEIELRGPTIFSGYIGADSPGESRAVDKWFRTGDAGYLDEDGFLYVVDRRADLIISGGENIYPAEIERVLEGHPLVAEVGVIGVPIEPWGTRPVAAVVWAGDRDGAEFLLKTYCQSRLASYKVPNRIVFVNSLPRTPSGKLKRRELANMLDVLPT